MLPDPSNDDRQVLDLLNDHISGKISGHKRGAFLGLRRAMDLHEDDVLMILSHQSKELKLLQEGLYGLVFAHLRLVWQDTINLVPGTASPDDGDPFLGRHVRSHASATVANVRYGSANTQRGKGYSYGYIHGRTPVKIEYILSIKHPRRDPELPPLEHQCAIVRPFLPSPRGNAMPWAHRYVSVGLMYAPPDHSHTGPTIWG